MDSKFIVEFNEQTNVFDKTVAFNCLLKHNWDLKSAVNDYNTNRTTIRAVNSTEELSETDGLRNDVISSAERQEQNKLFENDLIRKLTNLNIKSTNDDEEEYTFKRDKEDFIFDMVEEETNEENKISNEDTLDRKGLQEFLVVNADHTFILPSFFNRGKAFFKHLKSSLLDVNVKTSLEQTERLNWWSTEIGDQKLWPVSTVGDGNCLLHAASISMWGYHDFLLELRHMLYKFIQHGPYCETIKRRWQWNQSLINAEAGLLYTKDEWIKEWQIVIDLTSPVKRNDRQSNSYDGLEEVHILALSYLLHRVIIVISDNFLKNAHDEPFAPIPFGGIYIPIGCDLSNVCKTPILLAYNSSHFAPLLCMDREYPHDQSIPNIVPLVDVEGMLLPIKFHYDPGENFDWSSFDKEKSICGTLSLDEHTDYLKTYMNVFDLYNFTDENVAEENDNKNKTMKQFQNLSRHLTRVGKAMSKTIMKKLSSLATNPKTKHFDFIKYELLCAEIQPKMSSCQIHLIEEFFKLTQKHFVQKYVDTKWTLYGGNLTTDVGLQDVDGVITNNTSTSCSTIGCINNSCSKCLLNQNDQAFQQYGIGNSTFYTTAEVNSNTVLAHIPVTRAHSNNNQTLYLSNSTFYNDTIPFDTAGANGDVISTVCPTTEPSDYNINDTKKKNE